MRSGSIDILADTNVPIYAIDPSDPAKQQRATDVLNRLQADGRGALTAQVLNEFFVVATRKPIPPLSVADAEALIRIYVRTWPVLDLTSQTTLEAIRGVRTYQLAFWDALLWATARLNGIRYLLSEDGPTGAAIDGVRWVNPFAPGFNLAAL